MPDSPSASRPAGGVSIALCTYNGARFLGEQLASFNAQTLRPAELVVCDDGSTDDTVRLVREFAAVSPFPVTLHVNRDTLGSTKNFEKAIGLCRHDFIALSDQDDVWMKNKLETLVRVLQENHRACGVFSDAEIVDDYGHDEGYSLWDVVKFDERARIRFAAGGAFEVLASRNVVTGATLALRRSCLADVPPAPERSVHDAWLAWVLSAKGGLVPLADRLVRYRQHQGNQIGARRVSALAKLASGRPASRREWYSALAEEAEAVLETITVGEKERWLLKGRARHYQVRAGLDGLLARLLAIGRELMRGSYHRYADGFASALRDLWSD